MGKLPSSEIGVTFTGSSHPINIIREIIISVTDTGPGIAADDLPQVFNRFYRADKSRARNSGGTGLGLAIVRRLVEAHSGRVWAESPVSTNGDQPHGTRISFTLPAV